jgi:hypothetical protein
MKVQMVCRPVKEDGAMFGALIKGLLVCALALASLSLPASGSVWATISARKLNKKINKAAHKAARGAKKVGGKVAEGLARVAGCIAIQWSDGDEAEGTEITFDISVGGANSCSKQKVSRPATCPTPPLPRDRLRPHRPKSCIARRPPNRRF